MVPIVLLKTGLFFILSGAWIAAHASTDSPNILLVIADDMGVDASPCYSVGTEKPAMPVLERLCSTGVVFDNVWSNPECSPTRATILTGRYGFRTGVRSAILRNGGTGIGLGEVSIQKLLDQRLNDSYAHAVIGKWHLSDENNGGANNPGLMGIGHYSGLLRNGHSDYWKWDRTENGATYLKKEYATSVFTDEAIEWILDQEKPWFLWLAYTAPHDPFHLPPDSLHTRSELSGSREDIAENAIPYYLAMLESLDSELGRLLSSIPPADKEKTTVIFIGDNGTPSEVIQSPYETFQAKSSVFEGGVHIPMIVAGVGVSRTPQRETALINTTDLFATIADLANTGLTQVGDSLSFKHLLSGRSGPKRSHVYTEFHDRNRTWRNAWAIRDSRYKLIHFESGTQKLFDLIDDPFEKRNLIETGPTQINQAIANRLENAAIAIRSR